MEDDKYTSTKCPVCGEEMEYTGQPDLAGPIQFRFYRCLEHGVFKVWEEEKE